MSDDEPTTAAEMELLEELRKLLDAAGEVAEREMLDDFERDLLDVLRGFAAVLRRVNAVAELRVAKGLSPLNEANAELFTQLCQRYEQLREILEQIYEI